VAYFIFIDEAYPERKDYSQISGFIIDISNYVKLRNEVLSKHHEEWISKHSSDVYDPYKIPLYKWSSFMIGLDEEEKLCKLDFLYKTLYDHTAMVFCYGIHGPLFYSSGEIEYALNKFCWGQLQFIINQFQTDYIIIPVIDLGFDKGFVKQYKIYAIQNYSALNCKLRFGEKAVTIKNPENCIEPLFSTDEYSIGVQLADLVGGLQLFNSLKHKQLSKFNDKRKSVLDKWYNDPKTLCVFESWVKDEQGFHSEYHDSSFKGKENK
jgi:hypothetical protein